MERNAGVAPPLRGLLQLLQMPILPDRWCEVLRDDFVLIATPKPRHQQDAASNAGLSQLYALFGRGHTKPLCSLFLQGVRTLDQPVPIGVRFDHRTYLHLRSDILLDGAEVSS